MKRRLFSILLVLCMTIAMLPAAAFAGESSYDSDITIKHSGWKFTGDQTVCYYIPTTNGKFSVNQPNSGPFLKVTKTGENEITITVHGNVNISVNQRDTIKSIRNLIITGATAGENSLSLNTTTRGTAISVLGDLTITGIALTATAGNGHALRANNITVSDATLIATNNSAHSAAIQATQGDGPLGNLTVSGASAIAVTNNNANGRAIHATIINGNETPGQTDASQVTISSPALHSHICSDGWTSDATGHWHRCADANCTEKLNFAAHTGGTATCTAKKKCEICGEPYGELDPNNHTHLSDWIFDETGHWKTCNDCGAIIEKAAHSGGAATCTAKKKCTICGEPYGELDPSNHTALSGWASDETGHWKTCSTCNTDIEKTIHTGGAATCSTKKVCTVCGEPYGELNPSNHPHLSGWASDETHHWKTCSTCSTDIEKTAHTYSEWQITQKATAAEAGAKCRECSVCHYKETAAIPPIPCTHEGGTWESADDGEHHVKKCTACGAIIEKAAHTGGTATCNAKKKCEVCGQSYGELNPSNHTALSGWIFDETDHWKDCADCNRTGIDNAAHTLGEWIIDKEATATEAGLKHRTCSVCHYKETAAIPPGPCTHEGSTWEPADDGVHHVKKCADCGAEPAIEKHNFAYCDNMDGFHSMTCDVCGEARIEPHDFSHKTVPADDGKHRGQCVCGAFDAAKDHTYQNGSCTVCGVADPTPAKPTPGGSGIIITPEAADPAFLSGANQTVALGSAAAFRIDYNYAAFRSVAVDGVILTPADYTTWDGSTWVKLTAAYTKSLTPGTHTLSVYFDGATAATTFTVGGQPNPATGARDAAGIAAAAAAIALLGSAALLRKK